MTDEGTRAGAWLSRPWLARVVRIAVFVTPVVVSFVSTRALATRVPAAELGVHRGIWLAGLFVVSITLFVLADKVARRFLPLSTLLRLALAFPNEAPSRFRVAMRSSTTRGMQRRIEALRTDPSPADPTINYGERMLELVAALSRHDRLTRGHCERVRGYTDLIIEEMGIGSHDANLLRWSALLHDAGKLMVPANILNSKGRPTDEEWAILQTHPVEGMRLTESLVGWLGEWRHAVDQHHEWWDGSGYPYGLKGTDIHLAGRIVAVADAFDVMTSTRSYKKPKPASVARAELANNSGSQFDPDVVRAFLNVSVGRLRWMLGPVSWLGNLPAALQSALAPAAAPVATGVTALSVAIGSLGFLDPSLFDSAPPVAAERIEVESSTTTLPAGAVVVLPPPSSVATTTTLAGAAAPSTTATTSAPTSTTTRQPIAPGAPFAAGGQRQVSEDQRLALLLEGSVGSLTGTITILRQPAEGALTAAAPQQVRVGDRLELRLPVEYAPRQDFHGDDRIELRVCDAAGSCADAVVALVVDPVNDQPVAASDAFAVNRGGQVAYPMSQLMANDNDVDGDSLTVVAVSGASKGTISLVNGALNYRSDPDLWGSDSFVYTVDDGHGGRSTASVTVTIDGLAPSVVSDRFSVPVEGTVILNVLANDLDPEGLPLEVVDLSLSGAGSVSRLTDQSWRYWAPSSFSGPVHGTYVARDSDGMTAIGQFVIYVGYPDMKVSSATRGVGETSLQSSLVSGTVLIYADPAWTAASLERVDYSLVCGAFSHSNSDSSWHFDVFGAPFDTSTVAIPGGAARFCTLNATFRLVGGQVTSQGYTFTMVN